MPINRIRDERLELSRNYYARTAAVDGSRNAAAFVSTLCIAWLSLQAYGYWLTGLYEDRFIQWPIAIALTFWLIHIVLKLTIRLPWRD